MDESELAAMARVPPTTWSQMRGRVMACWKVGECEVHKGRYYNELLLHVSNKSDINARNRRLTNQKGITKDNPNDSLEEERESELVVGFGDATTQEEATSWRTSFEVYKSEHDQSVYVLLRDADWVAEKERFHPGLDIYKSVEKAAKEFWATEAGWQHKKAKRSNQCNWRRTYDAAISMKGNQVWKPRPAI
jgi:uncharacterized protein YdaU (DUF1376 family)